MNPGVSEAIFVPAIMSAGLVFSLVTIIRNVVHDRRRRDLLHAGH